MPYIGERYNAERVIFYECTLVETSNPPKPIPLTIAGMPARFVPPGDCGYVDLYGLAPYCNRRIADPCLNVTWSKKETPTKKQMCAVISAVSQLAHIQRVNFLPAAIVVELEYWDGKEYSRKSWPGTVANRATTYHHGTESFLTSVMNHACERILDPTGYFSGSLPQDVTDYINEPNWGILSPGVRVSTRACAEAALSTTPGIILKREGIAMSQLQTTDFLMGKSSTPPHLEGK